MQGDPPETVQARKLRTIPFLSNEDILQASMPPNQIEDQLSQENEQDSLVDRVEGATDEIAANEEISNSMGSFRSNSRSRGIAAQMI